jgi:[histone H3]-lysine4 N-trimethyltransferase ASH1L
MLFDQNMIIDATRGSIARFVNHSCEPNCRMVKWIVAGKPRMALFAGDRPIMTGEELTYDYNFDPFSAKNVQECRCGAESCRGVLGPRPKDKPKPTSGPGESIKHVAGAGKRKLEESFGGDKNIQKTPKKRKTNRSVKGSKPVKAGHAAKGIKRKLSNTMASTTKNAKSAVIKRELTKSRVVKRYSTATGRQKKQRVLSSSRKSNLALVNEEPKTGKTKWTGKVIKESITLNVVRSTRKRKLSIKGKELHSSKGKVSRTSGKE